MNQKQRRAGLLPTSLEIYITNKCNLKCRYCSSRAVKTDDIKTLTFREVSRAIDIFASHVSPDLTKNMGKDPAPTRTVGITGGEPFLEFELLKEVVGYMREKWPGLGIDVVTNATLLTPEKADFFIDRGVDLAVSLDGTKAATDLNRKFSPEGGSVFDAVMKNLGRLSKRQLENICVMTTFSSKTIDTLIEGVRFLRQFNFKEIILDLDMYEIWSEKGLLALRKVLRDLRQYYKRELKSGGIRWPQPSKMYGFTFENKLQAARNFPPTASMSLSNDGYFFPCDIFDFKSLQKYNAGNIQDGIDFKKLKNTYSFLCGYFKKHDYMDAVLPPVERYFYALSNRISPRKMLENGREVARIFKEELGVFINIERIFMELAREKSFGDFEHRPRYSSNKEIRVFRLKINSNSSGNITGKPGIVKARESLDYFLYSPGMRKELVIFTKDIPCGFEFLQKMVVYAVLKSKSLQKGLKVSMESDIGRLKNEELNLINEYGVFLGKPF